MTPGRLRLTFEAQQDPAAAAAAEVELPDIKVTTSAAEVHGGEGRRQALAVGQVHFTADLHPQALRVARDGDDPDYPY